MGTTKNQNSQAGFLPGALEMLVLKTLSRGPNHGFGIAQHIQQVSQDALRIGGACVRAPDGSNPAV